MRTAIVLVMVSGCAFGFEGRRGDSRARLEMGAFFGTGELIDDDPHVEARGVRARFQLLHGATLGWGATLARSEMSAAPEDTTTSRSYRTVTLVPELVLQLGSRFACHAGAGPTYGAVHDDETSESHATFGGQAVLAADVVPIRARRYELILRLSGVHVRSRPVEGGQFVASFIFLEGVFVFR